ncbi:glycosyltransferase [Pseudoruegeria sp. HB172150]|uniref:glycosyltransferase family 2 protein n=1 Tax=Pseudoruegeria sp. HB172150 TaxID=2721164 RepID=UPI0015528BE1|nr:glycosyltransferase [Pseudoruegeria sp. HB172150]
MNVSAPSLNTTSEKKRTVSVGLPVYNGAEFLGQAIESILAQDLGDLELIISDNASTDETPDICANYAAADERVSYVRHTENLGAAKNYNHVFHLSSAPYFKWAAHDDLMKPQFLTRCVEAFERQQTLPSLIYPRSEFIDSDNKVLYPDRNSMHTTSPAAAVRLHRAVQAMGLVTAVFGLFHRETLARTQLIGTYVASDYVLLLECALLGPVIHLDGEPLFQRRIHEKMSRQANRSDEEVLRWFDPKASKEKLSSRQRLRREFIKAIYRSDNLSAVEKPVCVATLFGSQTFRRVRVTGGRWRRKIRGESA